MTYYMSEDPGNPDPLLAELRRIADALEGIERRLESPVQVEEV